MFGLKSATPPRPNLTGDRVRVLLLSPEKAELMQRFRIDNKAHLEPWEPARTRAFIPLLSGEPSLQPRFEILMRATLVVLR